MVFVTRNALSGYPQNSLPPANLVIWQGVSRNTYQMELHPIGTIFNDVPGIYVLCHEAGPGQWFAHYIGEAENLNDRVGLSLVNHHKFRPALKSGATHICALIVRGGKTVRLSVETDLRHFYRPPLNDQ